MYFNKIYSAWRSIQREKYEAIYKMIKKHGIKVGLALDVGCGPFYLQEFFEEKGYFADFICIDIDKELSTLRYKFLFADGNKLPFKREIFDTVFIIDSIHFIEDFADIYGVLKLNGHLFAATFVNDHNIISKKEEMERKLRKFEIIDNIVNNGKEKELIFLVKKKR